MKTLTVDEASEGLRDWMRRAMGGEQIAIHEGNCTVLLQPLPQTQDGKAKGLVAREALRELQSRSRITSAEAHSYLCEVREERAAYDGRDRQ